MLEALLSLFTTEQKVQAMLAYPVIRLIFTTLIVGFILTIALHLALYFRIKRLNHYVKSTNRVDVEPLQTFASEYEDDLNKHIPLETIIKEKFSNIKFFNILNVRL